MEATVLPSELQCPICSCLLEDAVMMPCCAGTACDSCARAGILRSAGKCPVCGELASTEELIPYRLFRDKVDKFCTQTGYARARPPQHHQQPPKPPKPSLPDIVLPTLQGHRPPGSSVTDSPRGTSPPRPQTPTVSPPRSPGTPLSYPERRSRSPVTPYFHQNKAQGRGTPTTSPEYLSKPGPPGPTLLPPVHVLAPSSHWPPFPSATVPPTFLHPTEDPLAAFEAAMRKLDSKKASRGRHDPASPPRAYREERTRSRSRERLRNCRERDYSPRKKSPGGFKNCSPRGREKGSLRGSRYLAAPPATQREDREDYAESSWSRPRRERYVTDIPPETQEERRDRERFERNLAKRDTGSYRLKTESKGRKASNFEYQERKIIENEAFDVDTRTPSLSPEPDMGMQENGRRGEIGSCKRESTVEIRDGENSVTMLKKEEKYRKSRYQDHKNEELFHSDRSHERGRDTELSSYDKHCADDARDQDEHLDGLEKPRKREDWKQDEEKRSCDRSHGSAMVYVMESESKQISETDREKSINDDLTREISIEDERKVHAEKVYNGERLQEDILLNQAAKQNSEEVQEEKAHSEEKKTKRVKKSKKSKKKKSKDKKFRKCDKEDRERKKNKERSENYEASKLVEDVKSLVPYDEAEDTKTEDSSAENQEDKSSLTSNFISSFKETKIESRRAELDLPSLVLNKKTEDLAHKKVHSKEREQAILAKLQLYSESLSSSRCKEEVKGSRASEMKRDNNLSDVQALVSPELQAFPSVSSKWEREDILATECPELKHQLETESVLEPPKPSIHESSSGPQNVLRRALANMEKDHLLREKKRKSLEGTKSKKKKKKSKKKKSQVDHGSSEDESKLKVKKTKKKKSGLEISEKTLKKLLKKNLLRKEALEKMISDEGVKKKLKKKYSEGDKGKGKTRQSSSEEEVDKKIGKVSRLGCQDEERVKKSVRRKEVEERECSRKGNKRGSSEEGREVKASREGKIQVRLANKETSSMTPGKKSLASAVQANLLKMASQDSSGRGERGSRISPHRKSVKDRLGPVRREHYSPVRRSRLREKDGLEPVPFTLQAWAGRHSPVKQDRDNRRREEKSLKDDADGHGRKKSWKSKEKRGEKRFMK